MLIGISPLLGPDLLATLARMGHGDEIVLADAHFPAESIGRRVLRAWSAGCASGEESYTLKIVWDLKTSEAHPGVGCAIIATDVDRAMLERARKGFYPRGSLRELPETFIAQAFDQAGDLGWLKYLLTPNLIVTTLVKPSLANPSYGLENPQNQQNP